MELLHETVGVVAAPQPAPTPTKKTPKQEENPADKGMPDLLPQPLPRLRKAEKGIGQKKQLPGPGPLLLT